MKNPRLSSSLIYFLLDAAYFWLSWDCGTILVANASKFSNFSFMAQVSLSDLNFRVSDYDALLASAWRGGRGAALGASFSVAVGSCPEMKHLTTVVRNRFGLDGGWSSTGHVSDWMFKSRNGPSHWYSSGRSKRTWELVGGEWFSRTPRAFLVRTAVDTCNLAKCFFIASVA